MYPVLEAVATDSISYGDLPETWQVPRIDRFSTGKGLYDYQTDALRNAARNQKRQPINPTQSDLL